MDLDEHWYKGGCAADVYKELQLEESRYHPCEKEQTTYAPYRSVLVDWIVTSSKSIENSRNRTFSIGASTVHLAIRLIDLFFDRNHELPPSPEFYATAAAALIVAAKFEEKESHIPKLYGINKLMEKLGLRIEIDNLLLHEKKLLECLDWRLMIPTPPLFVPYFLSVSENEEYHRSIAPKVDSEEGGQTPVRGSISGLVLTPKTPGVGAFPRDHGKSLLRNQVEEDTETLLELTLKEHSFRFYHPSKIAAVCVAVSRYANNLPPWSLGLKTLSKYSELDIHQGFCLLLQMFKQVNPGRGGRSFPAPQLAESPREEIQSPVLLSNSRAPTHLDRQLMNEKSEDRPIHTSSPKEDDEEIRGLVRIPDNTEGPQRSGHPVVPRHPAFLALPPQYQQSLGSMQSNLLFQQLRHVNQILNPSRGVGAVGPRPVLAVRYVPVPVHTQAYAKWVMINGERRCFLVIPSGQVHQAIPPQPLPPPPPNSSTNNGRGLGDEDRRQAEPVRLKRPISEPSTGGGVIRKRVKRN